MVLETAQVLRRRRVGRPADKGRESAHIANVIVARLLAEAAHPHVLDHARPQRADGPDGRMGGHRGILSRAEGCWTFHARDPMPRSSRLTAYPAPKAPTATRAPIPRERVRSWVERRPRNPVSSVRFLPLVASVAGAAARRIPIRNFHRRSGAIKFRKKQNVGCRHPTQPRCPARSE